MNFDPGVYPDLPREEYDAIPACRYSDLKSLERSALLYQFRKQTPTVPTDPMRIGDACHTAILEPSLSNFAVWPGPGIRAGNAYKDWCVANAGKTLMNAKEMDHVIGISEAVHANKVAHKYLERGRRELSLVWFDSTWNRMFKARIDNAISASIDSDQDVLVSLKTTADCHDQMFARQCIKMCYHAQDAIYYSGWSHITGRQPRMITVAVDSKAPYESAVYVMGDEWILEGQAAVTRWVKRLNECEKTGVWPVAYEAERELEFPGWAATLGEFSMDDLEPIEP